MKKFGFLMMLLFFSRMNGAMCQESVIKGKVIDENGNPLAGAGISIGKIFRGTTSDQQGNYSFTGLTDGGYSLRFSFIGYETTTMEVILSGNAEVNVSLSPATFMTGEVLVNATRAGENTPLAYTTIDRERLKSSNTAQDIPYLLSLTPSLVETSEAGNGIGYTGMRIRGTDANRINVTIDGIPLNDPESQTVFWVDLPDLASSVDNIQIQRGVGTSSNGAGAFGATVSIQTANPENDPFAEADVSYGSFNTQKAMVSAGTGMLGNKFALQMRYSDLKSDGYIDRTASDHRSAFVSGVYRTGKSRLKANIILGEEHTGLGWWGVPKDSLATNRTYNPSGEYTDASGNLKYYHNETDNYNQDHYQLIYSLKAGTDLNLNAALHYTRGKGYYEEYRQDEDLIDYGMSPFISGGELISSSDLIRRKWLDNHFYGMVYSLSYKKKRAEFIGGGGMNRYLGDHYGTIIWMRNAGISEKDHQWYLNNSLKSEFNIFGKINYELSDKTSVFGDLQYRFIYYDMQGRDDDQKDLGQLHRYGFFNPKAGIFHSINDKQDVFLSFSVANREPSRTDFKEAAGDPDATPKPETLYDTELGYKLRTGNSVLAANLYGMFYKDQLVPTGELSDVGYSIMTNVSRSYRVGIELSAAMQFTEYLTWNSGITLSRNKIQNFTEYYLDYVGDSTLYSSKERGLVDIAYSPAAVWTNDIGLKAGIFGIHLISKYVGKQYFDNTMSGERSIDPYFVNNLRIDVLPRNKLTGFELQLTINNVLNEEYENNAYGGNYFVDGAEQTWAYYFPQAGRNYMLRLGIRF